MYHQLEGWASVLGNEVLQAYTYTFIYHGANAKRISLLTKILAGADPEEPECVSVS